MELHYLVLAAHPDDAELFCGGTLIKMRERGYNVGILDFTRGEAGTMGSAELRAEEVRLADTIIQPAFRGNLGLPDGRLEDNHETRSGVVEIVRQYRVKALIAPAEPCRHPDHAVVSRVARGAYFFAGAGKYPSAYLPWRPLRLLFHLEYADQKPSFVIDISAQMEAKMRAIDAYSSQFYTNGNTSEKTVVGSKRFREMMTARFRYYGAQAGCDYGEPYIMDEPLRVDDVLT